MRIAVNTRMLIKDRMDGIGWFTWESITALAYLHPEHEFFFLFDRPYHPSFHFAPNVTPVVIGPVTRLPALIRTWNRISVPLALRKIKPDLYLSPDGFLPPSLKIPSLVIIHDLNFEHHPEFLPSSYRRLYLDWIQRAARSASRILTVSEYSKHDIIERYGVEAERIDVVYCGLNSYIRPITEEGISHVVRKYGIGSPYFIVTGTLHPRKNIHRIIEAFGLFRQQHEGQFHLLFAGNRKWWNSAMDAALSANPYRSDIHFTGRVSGEELNALTQGAVALVFPSLYEGFGLPILEAAEAGIPVITSDHSSMKEIAGQTALLVDPLRSDSIAGGMLRIATETALRESLVQKSKTLLEKYSWDATTRLIWASIDKTIRQHNL